MAKNCVTKLKNLFLNSVDLCRTGANQKAHICLTKNLNEEENILENIASSVSKAFGIRDSEANILKIGNIISEALFGSEEEKIKMSMTQSLKSIMCDKNIDSGRKSEILEKSVSEFFSAVVDFTEKNQGIDRSESLKKSKGEDTDMIDVNKMTAEDKAVYEDLMKKYTLEQEGEKLPEKDAEQPEIQGSDEKPEMHPEIKKALNDFQNKMAELDEVKKSYEIREMEAAAEKYEIIGQKPKELAEKLYEYKKSGGTMYNDYIALLDEQLAMTKSIGIFDEIGSGRSGGAAEKQLEQRIREIMKSDNNITYEQAFVKACDENDELRKSFA